MTFPKTDKSYFLIEFGAPASGTIQPNYWIRIFHERIGGVFTWWIERSWLYYSPEQHQWKTAKDEQYSSDNMNKTLGHIKDELAGLKGNGYTFIRKELSKHFDVNLAGNLALEGYVAESLKPKKKPSVPPLADWNW